MVELLNEGTDTVSASVSWAMSANVENLVQTGLSNISATGNDLNNSITGNNGHNLLIGNAGDDSLYGGLGDDTLDGGAGIDSMVGGAGNDTYIIIDSTDILVEVAGGGIDTVQSSATYTLKAEFENLVLTGAAAISGTGTDLANVMTGNTGDNALNGLGGNDTIYGGDGNDTLNGGAGVDSMVGGNGNDSYYVDDIGDRIVEITTGGIDTVLTTITYTLGNFLENLSLLGSANLNGTGNTLANVLNGNGGDNLLMGMDGNDTIIAGNGNDTLDGGAGADSMVGGIGNDFYVVDNIGDVIVELASQGKDTVTASISYTLADTLENLVLSGTTGLTGNRKPAGQRDHRQLRGQRALWHGRQRHHRRRCGQRHDLWRHRQ